MERKREWDLDHLKQMIDVHKHMATLSVAGLLVTLNITSNFFSKPEGMMFLITSVAGFVICILSSLISQLSHIDKIKNEMIYDHNHPLRNKFASPIALSISGISLGVISTCAFVIVNWAKLS